MGYRLSKIYTRTGDDGYTQVEAKQRISKHSLLIEALGTLDELNCMLGLLLSSEIKQEDLHSGLIQIQHDLFNLGGELCPPHHPAISPERVIDLENRIDSWNESLPPLKEFILPGGNTVTAQCHLARAVCRRAERCLVGLHENHPLRPEILRYINRLSDFLFVAARILAKENLQPEVLWTSDKGKNQ